MTEHAAKRNWRYGTSKAVVWLREHSTYSGDECLIFPFARNRQKGYGSFVHEGKMHYAHRYMCELVNGPAPSDRPQAAHSCGQGHRGCVTPRHLSWKSNSENQLDRRHHGTAQPRRIRRTTPKILAAIRALKGIMTQAEIAAALGIAIGSVEYWQRHDRPIQRPGTSAWTERKRRRLARQAAQAHLT